MAATDAADHVLGAEPHHAVGDTQRIGANVAVLERIEPGYERLAAQPVS